MRSDWPSVWGWYTVLMFWSTFSIRHNSFVNVAVNLGSWLEMIRDGSP